MSPMCSEAEQREERGLEKGELVPRWTLRCVHESVDEWWREFEYGTRRWSRDTLSN